MLWRVPYERSAALYDLIYGDKAYAAEAEVVRAIIERERPAARTLLEVGCGTGGHLVFLREHFECEGIDLTPAMLERARVKLPDVPLQIGDMRTFTLPRTFDAVVSLFSVIGYVRSIEELDAAIESMARHLAPGGVLVVEPWFTPEQWQPGAKVHGKLHVDRDDMKLARFIVTERRGRFAVTPMHHLVATLEGVEHLVETHELFLAETHEYQAAFEKAGLARVRHEPDVLVRGAWIGVKC
jgi:ubiquinone/menaquinone biosynthesis C-methylase UbiE